MTEKNEPRNDCSTCLAFDADAGLCRRFAPVPAAGAAAQAMWPRVDDDDWCLEHRANTPPFGLTFIPGGGVDDSGGNG